MTEEEFIDHIALTTLVENLRKLTNPMTNIDANRLAHLAYATGEAMLEKKQKLGLKLKEKSA